MMENWYKAILFQTMVNNPGAWLVEAVRLKHAADELGWLDETHRPRGDTARITGDSWNFFVPVHRMLMGLSFENLLKGMLIVQGVTAGTAGKLENSFKTHIIDQLLGKLDKAAFSISADERKQLRVCQQYVEWQGRYPVPTKAQDCDVKMHGSEEHRVEQALWHRMRDYLVKTGWLVRTDGTMVKLKDMANTGNPSST